MENAKKKIREQGTCPYCGSDDIEWRGSELEDELMFYNAMCNKCKRDFVEVYKLEYDGYNTYDENGEEHLFDKEGNEL